MKQLKIKSNMNLRAKSIRPARGAPDWAGIQQSDAKQEEVRSGYFRKKVD